MAQTAAGRTELEGGGSRQGVCSGGPGHGLGKQWGGSEAGHCREAQPGLLVNWAQDTLGRGHLVGRLLLQTFSCSAFSLDFLLCDPTLWGKSCKFKCSSGRRRLPCTSDTGHCGAVEDQRAMPSPVRALPRSGPFLTTSIVGSFDCSREAGNPDVF